MTTAPPALLPDILRDRAATEPDRTAYLFLDDNGEETTTLTYGELHARALGLAAELRQWCSPGDRAVLVFPQCPEFIIAYFGCLYAGVIAVPLNPPRRNRIQEGTRSIVRDCAPMAVLSLDMFLTPLRAVLEPHCPATRWLGVDVMHAAAASFEPFRATPATTAFLQYTSGSTAAPKGVMVSHANLVANEEMIRRGFGHDRDSTVVGWAPFFHDQGLIGNVLQPVYVGATAVLMSPMAFIRRPLLWLSAITRYRAHTSGGPNFAFEACVARAAAGPVPKLDLSSWKVAFNGAEPIRADTLQRFTETFAPHGFSANAWYPCYGLAEATLLVSGSVPGRGPRLLETDTDALATGRYAPATGPRARTLVGSGQILPGEEVRIVDTATGEPCPPDRVGEIWVSGGHVAQGYWRNMAATDRTFRAGGRFLRTGDLGLLIDGELYVIGRAKDLIIIRGRNYYPQDLEQTAAAAHPALRTGSIAAFAIPAPDGEKPAVVAEIRRDAEADPVDVIGAIKAAVLAEHDLALTDVLLAAPDQVQRTSSGKIMRSAARQRYLAAEFTRWNPQPTNTPTH
ncbi:fatty acyl-AMP ligase [Nocardia aurantiaca]|uniref:AMP-binding protein n=1 Tax=Nocardia aurantiaca TaxID=2675850 RepID=A0A6I3KYP8_9NOCA|nr:fatty acyl-AMP ligase [Nocardia aurantiaca]MTE15863.1 AMP-binding protein [Nocardia aurantiaca]